MQLEVDLEFRPMQFEDLPDLDWSGGSHHLHALAEALARPDELDLLVGSVRAGAEHRFVACGAVDFTRAGADPTADPLLERGDHRGADVGELTMLSVHPSWQSLGVGTAMITALEQGISDRGLGTAQIAVEHDNPRAHALYARLGYRPTSARLDHWSIGARRRYVTVVSVLQKALTGLG